MSARKSPPVFTFKGPLFTTREAAEYLGYRGAHVLLSLYKFLKRKGVPTARRAAKRGLLIKKSDIDRAIGLTDARPGDRFSESQKASRA